jgi:hypothetical protein
METEKKTETEKKKIGTGKKTETERKRGGRQSASGRKKVRQGRRERRKKTKGKVSRRGTLCSKPALLSRAFSPLFRCASLPPSPIAIGNQKSKPTSLLLCSTCASFPVLVALCCVTVLLGAEPPVRREPLAARSSCFRSAFEATI